MTFANRPFLALPQMSWVAAEEDSTNASQVLAKALDVSSHPGTDGFVQCELHVSLNFNRFCHPCLLPWRTPYCHR